MFDKKIAHLKMLMSVINRLSNISLLLKSWPVLMACTLLLIVFNINFDSPAFVFICSLPFPLIVISCLINFWLLDGYFLWQERLFKSLYDDVRLLDEDQIDYSMNVDTFNRFHITWMESCFSATILGFHFAIGAPIIIAYLSMLIFL